MSYDLTSYVAMVEDDVRTPRFLEALRAVVRPGDHVLELGTGFGYFAVAAVQAGAAHVFAVEPNDAIAHGRAVAEANGCLDRITFLQAHAERVTLGTPCDVLLEDLRGISPLHRARLAVLRDVRGRLLKPGARSIPARDTLLVAPSELPDDLGRLSPDAPDVRHGIDISPIRTLLAYEIHRTHGGPESLLAAGAPWATLDYAALDAADPRGGAVFEVARAGRFAGFVSWFATTLADGIGYDTGPHGARTVYDRGFLPIGDPIAVREGDRIAVDLRTRFDGEDFVWAWNTTHTRGGREERRMSSNVATRLMSPARRMRREAGFAPQPGQFARRLAALGGLVDGERHLGTIAARLSETPGLGFASSSEALAWASALLARADEEPRG